MTLAPAMTAPVSSAIVPLIIPGGCRAFKEYQSEFGDPSAFTYGALRSMMIAYVPD